MTEAQSDVLIVGAGLTGLMAAREISNKGFKVTLVDEGAVVGGRLATRQVGHGTADQGAQFFTVRSDEFQRDVDRWLADQIVYKWSAGFSDGIRTPEQYDGFPRYVAKDGMSALAKYLADHLNSKVTLVTGSSITNIEQTESGWQVTDKSGHTYDAKAVLLSVPVPQSLALLNSVKGKLNTHDTRALERIQYLPCVAGLFEVEGEVNLPEPGALQRPDSVLTWIADNQRKGISPHARIVTVHASGSVSQNLWDLSDSEALGFIRQEFERLLEEDTIIRAAEIKRWRYSQPTILHSERYLLAQGLPPLAFAGDAFGEPRVEGAYLSGMAAGAALAARLS